MSTAPAQNYMEDPVSPQLRAAYEANRISVLWESDNGALPPAGEKMQAWSWEAIKPLMMETAKITLPAVIERRVMQLVNPTNAATGADATSGLINAGVQALMPGEHARPHRHSMHAIRFILEGSGAQTVVDGKACTMEPGDLVTTPGWTWHEHRNVGGAPTVWVDILDAAFQRALGIARFEHGPIYSPRDPIADGAFTSASFVPVAAQGGTEPYSPVFRYPWADAKRAVMAAPPASDGSRTVRYADPVNGGPVLPSLDCYLQQIDEGTQTDAVRTNANALCVVVEGRGTSTSGDVTVEWGPKTVFTIPQHSWTTHNCTSGPARIFVASNREIYRRLGILLEETQTSLKEKQA